MTQPANLRLVTEGTADSVIANQINAPGSATQTSLNARIAAVSGEVVTKRVCYPIGGVANTGTTSALNRGLRQVIRLPHTTSRWRVRHANVRVSQGTAGTCTMTSPGVALGGAPVIATSAPYGETEASQTAMVQVIAAYTVPTNGTPYVSEWVEDEANQFTAYQPRVLATGVVTLADGTVYYSGIANQCWWNRNNGATADLLTADPSGTYSFGGNMLGDWVLEVEYVEAKGRSRVQLYYGDSLTAGQTDTTSASNGSRGNSPFETVPGVAGLRKGNAFINCGLPGNTAAAYGNVFSRLDLATTVPDDAIIWMGSNDAAASRSLATFQADMKNAIDAIRAIGIKNIHVCTVAPRGLAAGPEAIRQSYNEWLRSNPMGVTSCIDIDAFVRNPSAVDTLQAIYAGADGIHMLRAAYQLIGEKMPG